MTLKMESKCHQNLISSLICPKDGKIFKSSCGKIPPTKERYIGTNYHANFHTDVDIDGCSMKPEGEGGGHNSLPGGWKAVHCHKTAKPEISTEVYATMPTKKVMPLPCFCLQKKDNKNCSRKAQFALSTKYLYEDCNFKEFNALTLRLMFNALML